LQHLPAVSRLFVHIKFLDARAPSTTAATAATAGRRLCSEGWTIAEADAAVQCAQEPSEADHPGGLNLHLACVISASLT
jgi:hypothetical protein